MATEFSDLAQHTGTLVTLIGSFAVICTVLVGVIYRLGLTFKTDLLTMIGSLGSKMDGIEEGVWIEINRIKNEDIGGIRQEQMNFRAAIPKEYLRVDGIGMKTILETLNRIEKHSEDVAAELRSQQNFIAAELQKRQKVVAAELRKRQDFEDGQ